MGDAAVDGTIADNMIEDNTTVDNPAAATKRRRWFLWRHIQGGEAEIRGKAESIKQEQESNL